VLSSLHLRTGPFVTHLETDSDQVLQGLRSLYDPSWFVPQPEFCDFHVAVRSPFLRRWLRPKAAFLFEGGSMFKPSPRAHGLPLFEWGLNWVIATNAHQYLIIHAAAVERGGRVLILPGPPGSGKSTLCTGLAYRGWRLMSDELALVRPTDGALVALARPISLKNESIEVIRRFVPDIVYGPPAEGTTKGTIVLARAPPDSMRRVDEPAMPGWIVFPRFAAGSETRLERRSSAETFIDLGANSLNYSILGLEGFETLASLVGDSDCFDLAYGDLDKAVDLLTGLADGAASG
jgi:HprK-related kinase A